MHETSSAMTVFHAALVDTPGRLLFASREVDETRALVAQVLKSHQLDLDGRAQRVDARMHRASFGEVSLYRLSYGADVRIRPGPLDDFYIVQLPVCGQAQVRSGTQSVASRAGVAVVLSPDEESDTLWKGDCDQLMLQVPRAALESTLAANLARKPDRPLRFEMELDCQAHPVWCATLAYLLDLAARRIDMSDNPLLVAQIEQLVVTTMLSTLKHNFSGASAARTGAALPRHVRKVMAYIDSHAHDAIRPEQLARLAGVSVRSLYSGFQSFRGMTPMQYLRRVRLERVRAELVGSSLVPSVASVACRWGFGHLGRFSADYRVRFGETPSETIRNR